MDNEKETKKIKKTTKSANTKKVSEKEKVSKTNADSKTTKTTTTAKTSKTTTSKPAAKKSTTVKVAKKDVTKVPTTKTVTTKESPVKKTEKKAPVKEEKVDVAIKEEKHEETKVFPKTTKPETKEVSSQEKISKTELLAIRKKRYTIEIIIVAILVFIALILLLNRTFLKTNYKTDYINIDIPRFTYYMSDKNNTVKLATLRKSANVKEYFNEYLEGFTFYNCEEGAKTFYYNANTKTLIEDIKVDKYFAVKVITVKYDKRSPEEVCGLL